MPIDEDLSGWKQNDLAYLFVLMITCIWLLIDTGPQQVIYSYTVE
jgi:hypothetical protein